jgi:hypothetical protein
VRNNGCDTFSERCTDARGGCSPVGGIFDCIVEQTGDGTVLIPAVLEHHGGHRHDMSEMRDCRCLTQLMAVHLLGEVERTQVAVG